MFSPITPAILIIIQELTMNVNQNNVRPNLSYILIRDYNIGLTVQKIQYLIAPRHHDFTDTAAAVIELQIAYLPQLSAVRGIDDILAFQLRKQHKTAPLTSFISYPMNPSVFSELNIFPLQVNTTTDRALTGTDRKTV